MLFSCGVGLGFNPFTTAAERGPQVRRGIKPSPRIKKNLLDIYINVLGKEFSERMDVFAGAFELYLPNGYEQNIKIFENTLGPELKQETGMFSEGWRLWPAGRYVEIHGLENRLVR
jgi:hypothetical protein